MIWNGVLRHPDDKRHSLLKLLTTHSTKVRQMHRMLYHHQALHCEASLPQPSVRRTSSLPATTI